MTMSDEQIDGLSGQKLREAVCLAIGWTREDAGGETKLFRSPGGNVRAWYDLPKPHADIGAAMSLLTGLITEQCLSVYIRITGFSSNTRVFVYESLGSIHADNVITEGLAVDHATVICRAFLKLKNRS